MNQATAPVPARRKAPRLPCSAPYQTPKTTEGRSAACRSHRAFISTFACNRDIKRSVEREDTLDQVEVRPQVRTRLTVAIVHADERIAVPEPALG